MWRTSHPWGSLGCFVRRDDEIFALTAAHLVRSALDGLIYDTDCRRIGTVADVSLSHDAALVRLDRSIQWSNEVSISGNAVVLRRITAIPASGGIKRGAATGLTVLNPMEIPHENYLWPPRTPRTKTHRWAEALRVARGRLARHVHPVPVCYYIGSLGHEVREGDSGSVVFTEPGDAFGLLVQAGNGFALATDLAAIAQEFGVHIAP
jgi:hypothetical protein